MAEDYIKKLREYKSYLEFNIKESKRMREAILDMTPGHLTIQAMNTYHNNEQIYLRSLEQLIGLFPELNRY